MKKLEILLLLVMLSGCSLMEAYLMKYDTNEYQYITEIRTMSQLGLAKCENYDETKRRAEDLYVRSMTFVNFAQYLPYNSSTQKASNELNSMIQGFHEQYQKNDKVSPLFCKLKLGNIISSAESMQKTIGAKPR